jgi:DNA-binding NarL/FixJ family response regulator
MTNREIADQLNMSVPSVKGRIARIIRKMEVRNRTEAIVARLRR